MNELQQLDELEKERLYKAPVYVSLLAANADGKMDAMEKKVAVEFSHVKTYSSSPILSDFYSEVENRFVANIEETDASLPKDKHEREKALCAELTRLEPVLAKLEKPYAIALHRSLNSYKEHVSKAHRNVLTSFILPVYIKGITDL